MMKYVLAAERAAAKADRVAAGTVALAEANRGLAGQVLGLQEEARQQRQQLAAAKTEVESGAAALAALQDDLCSLGQASQAGGISGSNTKPCTCIRSWARHSTRFLVPVQAAMQPAL